MKKLIVCLFLGLALVTANFSLVGCGGSGTKTEATKTPEKTKTPT